MAYLRSKCTVCGVPLQLAVAHIFESATIAAAICFGCIDQQFADRGGAFLQMRQEPDRALWHALYLTRPELESFRAHVRQNGTLPWVYPFVAFAVYTGA